MGKFNFRYLECHLVNYFLFFITFWQDYCTSFSKPRVSMSKLIQSKSAFNQRRKPNVSELKKSELSFLNNAASDSDKIRADQVWNRTELCWHFACLLNQHWTGLEYVKSLKQRCSAPFISGTSTRVMFYSCKICVRTDILRKLKVSVARRFHILKGDFTKFDVPAFFY